MFQYKAYGIVIQSHLKLPELNPSHGKPDLLINFGEVNFSETNHNINGTRFEISSDIIKLSWSEVGSFKLIEGQEIIIDLEEDVSENIIREVLLGPVFAVLLHQRGNLVLHSSAVSMGNNAIAFLGDAGFGKSTISMAMYNRGYSIITDDVLAINLDDTGAPVTYPSFPVIKLESSELTNEKYNIKILSKDKEQEKNFIYIGRDFSTSPIPVKILYILKRSNQVGIETIETQNALKELLKHSYCLKLFQNEEKAINLFQCANIIENIKVKVLNIGNSLEKLPEVVDMVEKDVL